MPVYIANSNYLDAFEARDLVLVLFLMGAFRLFLLKSRASGWYRALTLS